MSDKRPLLLFLSFGDSPRSTPYSPVVIDYIVPNPMPFKFHLSVFFAALTLFSCTAEKHTAPSCRTSGTNAMQAGSAACLIKIDNKVLLLRHTSSNQLVLPQGSVESGESAQCAAHRHTWQLTGMNVEVQQQVSTLADGTPLFRCQQSSDLASFNDVIPAPEWAAPNVSSLEKILPFELDAKALEHKDNLIPIRDGFVAAQ